MPSVRAIRGRRRSTLCAAAALALVAFLVSSCGKDSNADLSGGRASDLRASLDDVENRVAKGDCTGAAQQAADFKRQVSALPSRVDKDLRDALEGSAARLESLVSAQCKPAAVETTPAPEPPPTTDENTGGQQDNSEKDKKPKKPKKGTTGQEGTTGVTGQEGSTGVTGQDGGVGAPGGGG